MNTPNTVNVVDLGFDHKCFCSSTPDPILETVLLLDNVGRKRVIENVPKNAVLIMVPLGEFGATPFDILTQAIGNMVGVAVDEEQRRVFAQRPPMVRSEIYAMVEQIMAKNQSGIVIPGLVGMPGGRRS